VWGNGADDIGGITEARHGEVGRAAPEVRRVGRTVDGAVERGRAVEGSEVARLKPEMGMGDDRQLVSTSVAGRAQPGTEQ
jgi:hypothetical protein